jgi:phosphatidylglycerophosphate synthase
MADTTSPKQPSEYKVEVNSSFEPWLVENVCKPILEHVPRKVHPNSISVGNHILCWAIFIALASAPFVAPGLAFSLRIFAGLGLVASMILDCLDGMQARRTGRTSPLGAVLDHWLDALNLPLVSSGFVLTLGLDPVTTGVSIVLTGFVYIAQVALYHRSGVFVAPPGTDGAAAQFGLGLMTLVMAVLLLFVVRETRWVAIFLTGLAWCVNVMQVRVLAFYLRRLRKDLRIQAATMALLFAMAGCFAMGWMSPLAAALSLCFVTFRLAGSYILNAELKRPYSGWDWMLVAWVVAIALAGSALESMTFRGYSIENVVPYLGMVYIAAANLAELGRHFPELRAAAAPSAGLGRLRRG